jgi:hypothetical protein
MIYKGIETENKWRNGNWYTSFSSNGETIKTVEWSGSFGEEEVKEIIDNEILRFM